MSIGLSTDIAPLGNFALFDDAYMLGGVHIVSSSAQRNAIPNLRRKQGMHVYQQGSGWYRLLSSGSYVGTDVDWVQADFDNHSTFYYNPGVTGSAGTYGTWNSLWSALTSSNGYRTVLVDSDNANVATSAGNTDGVWECDGMIEFIGLSRYQIGTNSDTLTSLSFDSNAIISNPRAFRNINLFKTSSPSSGVRLGDYSGSLGFVSQRGGITLEDFAYYEDQNSALFFGLANTIGGGQSEGNDSRMHIKGRFAASNGLFWHVNDAITYHELYLDSTVTIPQDVVLGGASTSPVLPGTLTVYLAPGARFLSQSSFNGNLNLNYLTTEVVQQNGVLVGVRSKLNFIGNGVTVQDDAVNDRLNITIITGSGGSGGTGSIFVAQDNANIGFRPTVNFKGNAFTVTDNSTLNSVDVGVVPLISFTDEGSFTPGYKGSFASMSLSSFGMSQITVVGNSARLSVFPPTYKLNGTTVAATPNLNFSGSGVQSVTNDFAGTVTVVIPGSSGTQLVVQEDGTQVGTRPTMNFIGDGVRVADSSGNNRVNVTISGSAIKTNGTLVTSSSTTFNFSGSVSASFDGPKNQTTLTFGSSTLGVYNSTTLVNGFTNSFVFMNGLSASYDPTIDRVNVGLSSTATSSIQVQDEGTPIFNGSKVNFVGAGVSSAYDPINNRVDVSIPGAIISGAATVVVQDEGSTVTVTNTLNFVGGGVFADYDSGAGRVNVFIPTPNLTASYTGSTVGARGTYNFTGSGVSVTDDPGNNRININVPTQLLSASFTGSFIGARPTLNFSGSNIQVLDDPTNNRVNVIIGSPSVMTSFITASLTGTIVGVQPQFNFTGTVDVVNDLVNNRVNVIIPTASIQFKQGGTFIGKRSTLNVYGASIQDVPQNDEVQLIIGSPTLNFYQTGTFVATQGSINFTGDVSVTNDSPDFRVNVNFSTGSNTTDLLVEHDGSPVATVATLNFTGSGISASYNSGASRVDVYVAGQSPLTIFDDGVLVTSSTYRVNLSGSTISASYDGTNNWINVGVTIPSSTIIFEHTGTFVATRPILNFQGSGVTVSDNPAQNRFDVTINASSGSGGALNFYQTGTFVASYDTVNFTGPGVSVTDDFANGRATVFISTGSSSSALTVEHSGSVVGTQSTLNFIGTNLTVVDNPGNSSVDVSVNSTTFTGDGGSAVAAFGRGKSVSRPAQSQVTSSDLSLLCGNLVEFEGYVAGTFRSFDTPSVQLLLVDPRYLTNTLMTLGTPDAQVFDLVAVAAREYSNTTNWLLLATTGQGVYSASISFSYNTSGPSTPSSTTGLIPGFTNTAPGDLAGAAVVDGIDDHKYVFFTAPNGVSGSVELYAYDVSTGLGYNVPHGAGAAVRQPITWVPDKGLVFVTAANDVRYLQVSGTTGVSSGTITSLPDIIDLEFDGEQIIALQSGSSGQNIIAFSPDGQVRFTQPEPLMGPSSRIALSSVGCFAVSVTGTGEDSVAIRYDSRSGRRVGSHTDNSYGGGATAALASILDSGQVVTFTGGKNYSTDGTTQQLPAYQYTGYPSTFITALAANSGSNQVQVGYGSFTATNSAETAYAGASQEYTTFGTVLQQGCVRRILIAIHVNSTTTGGTNFEIVPVIDSVDQTVIPFTETGTGTFYIDTLVNYPMRSYSGGTPGNDSFFLKVRKNPASSDAMNWEVDYATSVSKDYYFNDLTHVTTLPYTFTNPNVVEWPIEVDDFGAIIAVNNDNGTSGDTFRFTLTDGTSSVYFDSTGVLATGTSYQVSYGTGAAMLVNPGSTISMTVENFTNPGNFPDWNLLTSSFFNTQGSYYSYFGRRLPFNYPASPTLVSGTLSTLNYAFNVENSATPDNNWFLEYYVTGTLLQAFPYQETATPGYNNSNSFSFPFSASLGQSLVVDSTKTQDIALFHSGAGSWQMSYLGAYSNGGFTAPPNANATLNVLTDGLSVCVSSPSTLIRQDKESLTLKSLNLGRLLDTTGGQVGKLNIDNAGNVGLDLYPTEAYASTDYTALPTDDLILVDSASGAHTITINSNSLFGIKSGITIKDVGNFASTNPITVIDGSGFTFDGLASSYVISEQLRSVKFRFNTFSGQWAIISETPPAVGTIIVEATGSNSGTRQTLNFLGLVSAVDNPYSNRVDITIAPYTSPTVSSDYSLAATDGMVYVDTVAATGAVTLTLPDPSVIPPGQRYRVKDKTGNAATNNINLAISGAATAIETAGAGPYVMTTNKGWLDAEYDVAATTWYLFPGVSP